MKESIMGEWESFPPAMWRFVKSSHLYSALYSTDSFKPALHGTNRKIMINDVKQLKKDNSVIFQMKSVQY